MEVSIPICHQDRGAPWAVATALFFTLLLVTSSAAQAISETATALATVEESFGAGRSRGQSWARYQTYVPQSREYFVDIGSSWEERSMYWVGGAMGFHLGRCAFSASQTCQQFVDGIVGISGADGLTMGLALASLRWQFVNFPKVAAPAFSIFAGLENIHDGDRNRETLAYGLGAGLVASVHERMDLKFEVRLGYGQGEAIWSQAFVSLGLKLDKWVDYFATKLRDLGVGTVEATGGVIKKTIEIVEQVEQKLVSLIIAERLATGHPVARARPARGEATGPAIKPAADVVNHQHDVDDLLAELGV